jgi:hypothetical protein
MYLLLLLGIACGLFDVFFEQGSSKCDRAFSYSLSLFTPSGQHGANQKVEEVLESDFPFPNFLSHILIRPIDTSTQSSVGREGNVCMFF